MKGKKGFTLVELLIVILVISILAGIAIPMYGKYKKQAIRTALLSDIRNCLGEIASARQTGSSQYLQDVVSNCAKSKFTQSIELESENPIKLKAISSEENFSCTYDENKGSVNCDSVF